MPRIRPGEFLEMWIAIIIAGLIGLLAVWELWICEGAHLGRRAVVFLYDITARRYERIKCFDPEWESCDKKSV